MAKTNGGGGLNFVAKLDITEAKARAKELEKIYADLGILSAKAQRDANNAAHAATMEALKAERLAILELNKQRAAAQLEITKIRLAQQEKNAADKEAIANAKAMKSESSKRGPTQFSNSQAEVDAYRNAANGNKEVTSTLNEQDLALQKVTNEMAQVKSATIENDKAQKQSNVTRKQAAQLLAEEKYIQSLATKELRNNAREQLNAKGSLEQRRAALIRLQGTFDKLSASERNSSSGLRLSKIIEGLNSQVLTLEKGTGRAQRNVGNYLDKAWSGLKGIANLLPGLGLAGLLGFLVTPLYEYIQGLDLLGSKLKEVSGESFVGPEYKEAIKNTQELTVNIEAAKNGIISKDRVVREYNETIGKTAGKLKTFDQVEKWQKDHVGEYLKMIQMKAEAQAFLAVAIDKSTEAAKRQVVGATIIDYAKSALQQIGTGSYSISGLRDNAQTFALLDAEKSKDEGEKAMAVFRKKTLEAEAFAKKHKLNFFSDTDTSNGKKSNPELEARNALQKKIDETVANANKKQLTADEQEIETVKLKYAALRKEVEEYYKLHKTYKVDPGSLNEAQRIEELAIVYKQDTEKLKNTISDQKKLYQDYEDFKNTFGLEEAKKRFGNLLNTEKTYLDRLNEERKKIVVDNDRSKYLDEQIKDEKLAEQKKYDALLKDFQSYADKRAVLEEKYTKIISDLLKEGKVEQARVASEKGNEEITALDEENAKKWASYENLFDFIGKRTKEKTQEAIEAFKKEVSEANISADAKKDLLKKVDDFEKGIDKKSKSSDLDKVVSSLREVATEFENINSSIGGISSVLLNSAKAYVEVLAGLEKFKAKDATGPEKIASGIGIVGAALSVANAISGYFKGLKAAKDAAKKAIEDFNQAAIKGELEYQALLRKRDTDMVARGKNSYQAIISQLELLKKQSPEIQKAYDKVYAALQGQSAVDSIGYRHGTLVRKAKTWDIMASLAGSNFANLEQLYTQGKLKDQAKADFEALKQLRDELEAAGISAQELQDQLKELLTGTSTSGLADSLTQLFQNGKFAAKDFGDSFEEIMRTAITNSFRLKVMEDALTPFYNEFAALFISGTPTDKQIADLKLKYESLGAQLGQQFKDLENITGVKLTDGSASPSSGSLTGGIKGITEDTAQVVAGAMRGTQASVMQTNDLLRPIGKSIGDLYRIALDNFDTAQRIQANTLRTADNTEFLKSIDQRLKDNNASVIAGLRAAGIVI